MYFLGWILVFWWKVGQANCIKRFSRKSLQIRGQRLRIYNRYLIKKHCPFVCMHNLFWYYCLERKWKIRDLSRDDCIKEFIKGKWSSGLFWAVGAAEKKPPNVLGWFFQLFVGKKNNFNFPKYILASALKSYMTK